MNKPPVSKKAAKIIKPIMLFAIKHRKEISISFSGITICGVMAGLGLVWNRIVCILNAPVSLWVVIAILPLSGYAVVTMTISIVKAARNPTYLSFTSMKYEEWKLEWSYERNKKTKEYDIKNILPVCNNCGCELEEYDVINAGTYLHCPICKDALYKLFDKHSAVTKIIKHKIKSM